MAMLLCCAPGAVIAQQQTAPGTITFSYEHSWAKTWGECRDHGETTTRFHGTLKIAMGSEDPYGWDGRGTGTVEGSEHSTTTYIACVGKPGSCTLTVTKNAPSQAVRPAVQIRKEDDGTFTLNIADVSSAKATEETINSCTADGGKPQYRPSSMSLSFFLSSPPRIEPAKNGVWTGSMTKTTPDGATFTLSWNLKQPGAPDQPTIALNGCTDIVVGKAVNLTAKATPPGGKFKFTSNKPDVVELAPLGAAAAATARQAGEATVGVEYTSPKGTTATTSEVVHCVEVKSVNNGEPITLGLYDVQGNRRDANVSVPADVQPANTNRVIFSSSNTAAASAALSGDGTLTIVTKAPGKTTLQGVTSCGAKTGPAVVVDVVPCDNEVLAQLKAQEKAARTRLRNAIREATEITGDDEFDRAAREGPEHIKQLAQKTAELIAKLAAGSATSKVNDINKVYQEGRDLGVIDMNKLEQIEHFSKLAESVKQFDGISDAAAIGEMADNAMNDRYDETAKAAAEMALDKIGDKLTKDTWGVGKTAYEAANASMAVGQDLGTMVGAADRLEELEQHIRDASREFDRVWKLLNETCKVPKPQPPTAPPSKPGPQQKPAASAPKKTAGGGGMKITDVPAEDAKRTGDQSSNEPPIVEPKREQAPKSVAPGLFRDEEKQCMDWQPLPQTGEGAFGILADNITMLKGTNEKYRTETLEPLANQLEATRQIVSQYITVMKLPESQRASQVELLRKQMADNPPARLLEFAGSIEKYNNKMSACAPALQNSFEVKIDEIKVKY